MKKPVFMQGARAALGPPGLILMVTFFAFGTFLGSLNYPLLIGLGLTISTFAIPSQIILIDELSRGSSIVAATIAASLTAVRLLPMTMSLVPVLRGSKTPHWQLYALCHFNSVTIWLQSQESLRTLPRDDRPPFFVGLCFCLVILTSFTTIIGFYAAHLLPPTLLAAALLVTPVYFFLSLFNTARVQADKLAFLFGTTLAIPLMHFAPDLALVGGGLIGGTAAYFLGRRKNDTARKADTQDKGYGE